MMEKMKYVTEFEKRQTAWAEENISLTKILKQLGSAKSIISEILKGKISATAKQTLWGKQKLHHDKRGKLTL